MMNKNGGKVENWGNQICLHPFSIMVLKRRMTLSVLSLIFLLIGSGYSSDWELFRGNPLQNGFSKAKLPEKLELKWKYSTKDSIEGSVTIAEGMVYAGSFDQHLYALNLQDGTLKWKVKLGPIKSSPVVKKDRLYVGDTDGNFFCVNRADGKMLWKFQTQGEITGGANFYKESILIGSHDCTLYCLDTNGKKQWEFKTEGPVNGSPAIVDGKTFVAGCDSNLHIIDIKEGKELATVDLGGQAGATAAIDGKFLYVGTMNNEVLAIDLDKKEILWRFSPKQRALPFYASAAIADNYIVTGSRDKRVYALDRKTGEVKWNFLTEGKIDSSPVINGKRVFVGSFDRNFYELEIDTGKVIQTRELDGAILASPAIADGNVIIATEKGTIYTFGDSNKMK